MAEALLAGRKLHVVERGAASHLLSSLGRKATGDKLFAPFDILQMVTSSFEEPQQDLVMDAGKRSCCLATILRWPSRYKLMLSSFMGTPLLGLLARRIETFSIYL